jgi:hypothetical protein
VILVLATSSLPGTSSTSGNVFEQSDSRISVLTVANSTIPVASSSSGHVFELSHSQKIMEEMLSFER